MFQNFGNMTNEGVTLKGGCIGVCFNFREEPE